jgi:hypothetical protein
MHEQYSRWSADRTGAMSTAADIVGEKYIAAATPVFLPIARFDFQRAREHDEKLAPRGRVPVLVKALGHLRQHRALRRQYPRAVDDISEGVGRRVIYRDIDLDKLGPAIRRGSKADEFHLGLSKRCADRRKLAYQAEVPLAR